MATLYAAVFAHAIHSPPLAAACLSPDARTAVECGPNGFRLEGSGEDVRVRIIAMDAQGHRVDPIRLVRLPVLSKGFLGEPFELPEMETYCLVGGDTEEAPERMIEVDAVDDPNTTTTTFMPAAPRYTDEASLPHPLPLRGISRLYRLLTVTGHQLSYCPRRSLAASALWLQRTHSLTEAHTPDAVGPIPIAMRMRCVVLLPELANLLDVLPVVAWWEEGCYHPRDWSYQTPFLQEATRQRLLELGGRNVKSTVAELERGSFPNLQSLVFRRKAHTSYDALKGVLTNSPRLRFLHLQKCFWPFAIPALPMPSSLEAVAVSLDPITARLGWLARCHELREVSLRDTRSVGKFYDLDEPPDEPRGNEDRSTLFVGPPVILPEGVNGSNADEVDRRGLAFDLDLAPLADLPQLAKLTVDSLFLKTLEPLGACRQLQEVCLRGCRNITSLNALAASPAAVCIRHLNLSGTGITNLPNGMAARFPSLEVLDVSRTSLEGVEPLGGAALLTDLDLVHTPVVNLAPLASCPQLRRLRVSAPETLGSPPTRPPRRLRLLDVSSGDDSGADEEMDTHSATGSRVPLVDFHRLTTLEVLGIVGEGTIDASTVFPASLRQLRLESCRLLSLAGLHPARHSLEVLVCRCCALRQPVVSELSVLTRLEVFEATQQHGVSDLTFLRGSAGTLRIVNIDGIIPRWEPFSLDGLETCASLQRLVIREVGGLCDLGPLSALCKLREVILESTSVTTLDALACSSPSLELVDVVGCTSLTEFGGAFRESTRLRHLNMRSTAVADISSLQNCPFLEKVDGQGSRNVTNLDSALAGLRRLHTVLFPHSGVTAIHELCLCPHLRYVMLEGCTHLATIDGLLGAPSLDSLFLKSLPSLRTLGNPQRTGHLSYLEVTECAELTRIVGIDKEPRLTCVCVRQAPRLVCVGNRSRGFRRLQRLSLERCKQFRDLSPLVAAARLTTLTLHECAVSDLRPLSACLVQSLTGLSLHGCNRLEDITPLRLGKHLVTLTLSSTGITNLRALTSCHRLTFLSVTRCTRLFALDPLAELPGLAAIDAQQTSISTAEDVWRHRRRSVDLKGSRSLDPEHVRKLRACTTWRFVPPNVET